MITETVDVLTKENKNIFQKTIQEREELKRRKAEFKAGIKKGINPK